MAFFATNVRGCVRCAAANCRFLTTRSGLEIFSVVKTQIAIRCLFAPDRNLPLPAMRKVRQNRGWGPSTLLVLLTDTRLRSLAQADFRLSGDRQELIELGQCKDLTYLVMNP